MNKKITLLLLVFFLNNALAMVNGRGSFVSQKGDSAIFVKQQLKYQAFKDIITRELSSMKLDPQIFWQNHYNKFEDSFQSIRQKLKENFEQQKLSAKEYQDALRIQKLSAMARFGNLNRLIKSYSEKGHTRSFDNPNIRHLEIDATLDRRALARTYFKTIRSKQKSYNYQRIHLSTEFQLRGDNWTAIGVNKKSDFTETLNFHWKKWFEKQYPNIREVTLVNSASWEYLKNHLQTPHSEIQAGHYKNSNASLPRQFQNGLWIMVKISIKKIKEINLSKNQNFHVEGSVVMVDLNTRKIVTYKDIPLVEKEYTFSTPHKLSSDLATLIWKLPLKTFQSKPAQTVLDTKRIGLVIREIGSIKDIMQIKELLINRGLSMRFQPRIATYSGNYGIIQLTYQGTPEKALNIINSLNGVHLKQEKKIVSQEPFSFAIKSL